MNISEDNDNGQKLEFININDETKEILKSFVNNEISVSFF